MRFCDNIMVLVVLCRGNIVFFFVFVDSLRKQQFSTYAIQAVVKELCPGNAIWPGRCELFSFTVFSPIEIVDKF